MPDVEFVGIESFLPTLPTFQGGIIAAMTLLVSLFAILVQIKVLKMLRLRADRAINRMIFFQQVSYYYVDT